MTEEKCETECCEKGILIEDKCMCDIGSFGEDCRLNLQDIYIAPYYTFIGIYCVAFSLVLLVTIRQFQTSLKTQRIPSYYTCIQYAYALIGSPQNYILVLTMVLSVCKLIWLILDPIEIYRGNTTVIERLLAEVVYTILFYIYGCLLIVWYTMYDEISYNIYQGEVKKPRKWIFTYYKEALKLRLFIVLLVQITVSTLNGLRKGVQYPIFLMVCYVFLMANFFLFIVEFIIYGSSLQTCIKDQITICRSQFRIQYQGMEQQLKLQLQKEESMSKSPESVLRVARFSRQKEILDYIEEQKKEIQDEVKQMDEPKLKIGQTKIKSVSFARTFVKGFRGSSLFRQESQKQLKSNKSNQKNQDLNSDSSAKDLDNQFKEEATDEEINSCCLNENQSNSMKWENEKDREAYLDTIKMQIKAVKETKDSAEKRKESLQQQQLQKVVRERGEQKKLSYVGSSQQDYKTSIHQQSDEDQEKFNLKSSNLAVDRQILFKIQLLVYFGIILEILFGGLSIAVLVTDLIRDPIGVLVYLYGSSTLQFFSLITVLKLFRDIKNQEIKNLIWIQKVGNQKNKINQQYMFSIPEDQKEDVQKQKFEQRINMNTLY